jgi:hypothetical protein
MKVEIFSVFLCVSIFINACSPRNKTATGTDGSGIVENREPVPVVVDPEAIDVKNPVVDSDPKSPFPDPPNTTPIPEPPSMSSQEPPVSRMALAAKYPSIEEGSLKPENPKILCPFHRLLERAGLYDSEKKDQSPLTVSISKIANFAKEFGCSIGACAAVATLVSGGQLTKGSTKFAYVNLEALHTAAGVAHECGLNFAKDGTVVDNAIRAKTLAALQKRADSNGRLKFSDLEAVKADTCAERGVAVSIGSTTEIGLIYTFLGGNERGFIDFADVKRFFHAELPKTIGEPSVPNADPAAPGGQLRLH